MIRLLFLLFVLTGALVLLILGLVWKDWSLALFGGVWLLLEVWHIPETLGRTT